MEVNTREALDAPNFGLETLNLSDIQIEFLVEFLRALTDPCVTDSNCLARWIPDAERVGPNEDQLNAVIIDSSFPQ